MRKAVVSGAVAGIALLLLASPAAADPAKPTDYRSVIQRVEPHPDGLEVTIVGGDSFLQVDVERGHELVVYAFEGEPFLRIQTDGTVEQNRQSPYTYSIESRYGEQAPPGLDPDGPAQWQKVGEGGAYTWHDHRIHWMSPTRKPGIEAGDVVQTWEVPMTFDGTDVRVTGVLVLEHGVTPVPWIGLGLVAVAAVVLAGRGKSAFVATVATIVAAAAALYVGFGEYRNVPDGAGPNALQVVLPAIALAAAATGLMFHRARLFVVATLAAIAAVGGWVIMRAAVFTKPVLPTGLPFGVDRAGTALAAGIAVAAAVLAVRSGALVPHFDALEDDEDV